MSMQVQYKNGYIGFASDKVAEMLEKKGEVEILDVKEPAQPELIETEKPATKKARR